MIQHLAYPRSVAAFLVCAAALLPLSTTAATPDPVKLAIFDFEFEDMSAAASAGEIAAADSQHLAEVTRSVRDLFDKSGHYSLSTSAVRVRPRSRRARCANSMAATPRSRNSWGPSSPSSAW